MNWEAIGAIAEIVGSGAVVVSLIYLAVQIRHSNRQTEIEALRNTWGEMNQMCDSLTGSKELASIVNRGRDSLENLDADEFLMFQHYYLRLLNTLESWHLQVMQTSKPGPYRDRQIENLGEVVQGYIDYPGVREMWRGIRHYFQPIAEIVDRNISANTSPAEK